MIRKNILLSVTGLSPQVVTETLYGIIQAGWEWPDEIQIITTKKGKEQARLGLITAEKGSVSTLEQLCREYDKPCPILNEELIYVVPDAAGNAVDDARTCEDQEALADYIVKHVAHLCDNDEIQLHASLAGGRKTMTFFLGYAMSLFSRVGDRLSHVLVEEAFEGNPAFYYPTKSSVSIPSRNSQLRLDTSKAKVMLAEIPFIRHKYQLKKSKLHSLANESYRELVIYQNAANEIGHIYLRFNLIQRRLTVFGDNIPEKHIYFTQEPMELAFYSMIARQVVETGYSRLKKPEACITSGKEVEKNEKRYLTMLFLKEMESIAGIKEQTQSTSEMNAFFADFERRMINLTEQDLVRSNGDIAETYNNLQCGMPDTFFNDRLHKLKTKLEKHFPADFARIILPGQVYDKKNPKKVRPYSTGSQQETAYGLWISAENIFYS